jgi:hypothetical protein
MHYTTGVEYLKLHYRVVALHNLDSLQVMLWAAENSMPMV